MDSADPPGFLGVSCGLCHPVVLHLPAFLITALPLRHGGDHRTQVNTFPGAPSRCLIHETFEGERTGISPVSSMGRPSR